MNNRAENLRWDTVRANLHDQRLHGTFGFHGTPKLTEQDVLQIVERIKLGDGIKAIAEDFNVAHSAVSAINVGRFWKSVTGRTIADADPNSRRGSKLRGILTERDVEEIIERLSIGESQVSIARSFGVTPQCISDINTGKIWSWMTGRTKDSARPALKKGREVSKVVGFE